MEPMLRSIVRSSKSSAKHRVLTPGGFTNVPEPARITIVQADNGYYLLREDEYGICVADTWHGSIESAIRQAEFEYELDGWSAI